MQVNPSAIGHQGIKSCKAMHAAKLQWEVVSNSAVAMGHKFFAYGEELDRVEVFKYLGQFVEFNGDDTHAVRKNLKKAMRYWARISRILWLENASAQLNGMFYKAMVQVFLLFRSETWCLVPVTL